METSMNCGLETCHEIVVPLLLTLTYRGMSEVDQGGVVNFRYFFLGPIGPGCFCVQRILEHRCYPCRRGYCLCSRVNWGVQDGAE